MNALLDASPRVLATTPLEQLDGISAPSVEQTAMLLRKSVVEAFSLEAPKSIIGELPAYARVYLEYCTEKEKEENQITKQTSNPSALSDKAVSKPGSSTVSEESKSPSSPDGDFWVYLVRAILQKTGWTARG